MPASKTLFSVLAGAATVAAHGHVENIVINGVYYAGYDVTTYPYESDPPTVIGWATDATDNGYVAPDAYGDSDIICHKNAENAGGHAEVAAGDKIFIQWTDWPESHHGPVLDYLASCGDTGCESVDKTSLEFFKIGEKGLIDGSTSPGEYASDELIDDGNGWLVQVPSTLKAGYYVLRHEIIALHSAENEDGAQNYPQCFNLKVTGDGTELPDGTLGTSLYTEDEDGIVFNIYTTVSSYPIPGPTLVSGLSTISQSTSAITSTGTATSGTGTAAAATDSSDSTSAAAAAATSAAATSAAAVSSNVVVSSAAAETPVAETSAAAIVVASSSTSSAAAAATSSSSSSGRCSSTRRRKTKRSLNRRFTPNQA